MRKLVCVVCLGVALAASAVAQQGAANVDSTTAGAVRRLLAMTGAARLGLEAMEKMVPPQRAANPQIPPAFWDAFLAHARRDTTQLIELLIPIYAAHFSRAELEQLLQFYQSPIGRRLAAVQPLILQESMEVGQQWGARLGQQIADSLSRAGGKAPPR